MELGFIDLDKESTILDFMVSQGIGSVKKKSLTAFSSK